MNELQSVTNIDEVIKYAEREAEGYHQMASAYHTDEGVYIHEETRFQYKAILWENIHEWLEELKELRKQKRPHGEWEVIGRETFSPTVTYLCSACKAKEVSCIPNDKPHYCENCGADMTKGGEDGCPNRL